MDAHGLEVGFLLDRRWSFMQGGKMDWTKRETLATLANLLAEVPYAIIGGLALQAHRSEPRTTLDIDIAVISYDALPRAALEAAGFRCKARHAHSENWESADGTSVEFSDDAAFASAIARAEVVTLHDADLRVITCADLLREKLRAGQDPARRPSKRKQDLIDAEQLIEDHPELMAELSPDEQALLGLA
jgi:hypothetical protein